MKRLDLEREGRSAKVELLIFIAQCFAIGIAIFITIMSLVWDLK